MQTVVYSSLVIGSECRKDLKNLVEKSKFELSLAALDASTRIDYVIRQVDLGK